MASQGVRELILVAQETTVYGTDLYGKKADVVLLQYLRPEQTFDNMELLKQQINRDICAAREYREETET